MRLAVIAAIETTAQLVVGARICMKTTSSECFAEQEEPPERMRLVGDPWPAIAVNVN